MLNFGLTVKRAVSVCALSILSCSYLALPHARPGECHVLALSLLTKALALSAADCELSLRTVTICHSGAQSLLASMQLKFCGREIKIVCYSRCFLLNRMLTEQHTDLFLSRRGFFHRSLFLCAKCK